jgi:hypothetical protein
MCYLYLLKHSIIIWGMCAKGCIPLWGAYTRFQLCNTQIPAAYPYIHTEILICLMSNVFGILPSLKTLTIKVPTWNWHIASVNASHRMLLQLRRCPVPTGCPVLYVSGPAPMKIINAFAEDNRLQWCTCAHVACGKKNIHFEQEAACSELPEHMAEGAVTPWAERVALSASQYPSPLPNRRN